MNAFSAGASNREPEPRQDGTSRTDLIELLLEALPRSRHADFRAITNEREVPAGEVLLSEGQRCGHVGFLREGALGMQKTLSDGRLHIIGLLVPHDMFGRLFDGPCSYDLVALTDSRLVEFDRDGFEELLGAAPEAENLILARILDELDSAREWILLMGGRKVSERVASFLLVLLRRELRSPTPSAPVRLTIPIRRSDLARYLGSRRESLSRALHQLHDEGSIALINPYTVEVRDLSALVRASGSDMILGAG